MKIGLYLAIIMVVSGGLKWAHSTTYTAGWNAHQIEVDAMIVSAKDEAVETARLEWESTRGVAEKEIVYEERIVERIRIVEKLIPTIVEKIVEFRPECRDLGDDFAGLLNAQVRARSSDENSGADIATEFNAALPRDDGIR